MYASLIVIECELHIIIVTCWYVPCVILFIRSCRFLKEFFFNAKWFTDKYVLQ